VQERAVLGTPELRQTVVSHIHDLAALALSANRDSRSPGAADLDGSRQHGITEILVHNGGCREATLAASFVLRNHSRVRFGSWAIPASGEECPSRTNGSRS
jgi:hypothetical protein